MTEHLHCQCCGAHFSNQAELDNHPGCTPAQKRHHSGYQLDADPGVSGSPSTRKDHEFTRSPKE